MKFHQKFLPEESP